MWNNHKYIFKLLEVDREKKRNERIRYGNKGNFMVVFRTQSNISDGAYGEHS